VNHPADVYKVQWHRIDDAITSNVEIWNAFSTGDQEAGFGNALWALRAGFRLGVVGVSDDHHLDRSPAGVGTGLTGCDVPALTQADLLAALRARRCYGTSGERIILDLRVNGTPMGGEIAAPLGTTVTVEVAVMGTDTPTAVEILRNGTVVATRTDCPGLGCPFTAPVEIVDRHTFVYARVQQAGGERAWSSPVWVRGECARRGDCPLDRLAPGGGPASRDCLAEWAAPGRFDRGTARSRSRLTCTDGDARCDFGAAAGECTFRVGLCVGVEDPRLRRCAPIGIDRWDLVSPGTDAEPGGVDDLDFQNRRTLLAAVRALGPSPAAGACTPLVDLRVPAGSPRGVGSREIAGVARVAGRSDPDRLVLRCRRSRASGGPLRTRREAFEG
jgi:hypothetical protein